MNNLSFKTSEKCKNSVTYIHNKTFKTIIKFAGNINELKKLYLIRNKFNKKYKLSNQKKKVNNNFKYYNLNDKSSF